MRAQEIAQARLTSLTEFAIPQHGESGRGWELSVLRNLPIRKVPTGLSL